jgi:GDP-4-dehydro-6-deoxy-D-mannose reductase
MKKVLITGASGFAGGYLAQHLLDLGGYEIFGTYRSDSSKDASPVKDKITFLQADTQDKEQLKKVLSEVQPEGIFHLAAQAAIGESIKNPLQTLHNNIDSELLLFEALKELEMKNTRVLIVLSADVYGYVQPEDLPIDENTPFRPGNPYAVSKVACDFLAYQYWRSYKLPIIRVRPFTHMGPGQKTGFVTSDFAKQIAEIEKGKQEPVVKVGNLDAKRDFTDVRDIVRAYTMVMEKGEVGEVYNIGSGASHKIEEVLTFFMDHAKVQVTKETDPTRLRPSDIPDFIADYSKLHNLTGWKPEIPFETSLQDILEYWRSLIL